MRKSKFTTEQMACGLTQTEAGVPVPEAPEAHRVSADTQMAGARSCER